MRAALRLGFKCVRCAWKLIPHKTVDGVMKCVMCGALYTDGLVAEMAQNFKEQAIEQGNKRSRR